MSNISRKLKEARPRLRSIAPMSSSLTAGYAIFNLVLGTGLLFQKARTVEFFIVNDFISYQVWGMIFIILGILMGSAPIGNSWRLTRWTLIVGIFLKIWWLLALIVRDVFQDGHNSMLLIMWAFITFVQIVLFVNFLPKDIDRKTD